MGRSPGFRLILSAALLLCLASAARAQYFGRNKVHYDRLEFQLLQTEHFDIYYYAEEEAATRHAARDAAVSVPTASRATDPPESSDSPASPRS